MPPLTYSASAQTPERPVACVPAVSGDAQGVEMPAARLRILIADDHVPLRVALRWALEDGGIEVCAEPWTGVQAIDAALIVRPDVCLIDFRLPDGAAHARLLRALRHG